MNTYDVCRNLVEGHIKRRDIIYVLDYTYPVAVVSCFEISIYPCPIINVILYKSEELFLGIEIGISTYYLHWPLSINDFKEIRNRSLFRKETGLTALERIMCPYKNYRKYFAMKYNLR